MGDSLGGAIGYTWANQRLESMRMTTEESKSAQVDFTHDSMGRLSSVSRMTNDNSATTPSASSGTTLLTMNLLDRVTSITHLKVGASTNTLSQFSYSYDANGRVNSYTGPEGSLSFAQDANGQLLSVTGSQAESYAYDSNGNRSTSTKGVGNLLLSDSQFNYTYDFEGNRKTKTRLSDGQVTEYYWDHRNQLTLALVKNANGVILKELRFTYDVEGRRVGTWVDADGSGPANPDQLWTVFDGANPYLDLDSAGQLKTRYLHGPGIDELFARIGTGEDPEWYLKDRLGSVRQIVNGSGTILDEITYDSYGNILCETNPNQGDRFKFTGREFSSELGIYYYRARWYDPSTGQFISQDPIGFSAGDPNLYRYVDNGPGDGTDPWGLDVRIESTDAAKGLHHKITVDLWDNNGRWMGTYSISFGMINSGGAASQGTNASGEGTPTNGESNGIIYRDKDVPIKIIDRLATTPEQDKLIEKWFKSLEHRRGNYNLIFYNCRSFSREIFEIIRRWRQPIRR